MLHNGNVTLGLGSRKGSLLFQCIFSRESKSLENHLFCFQYLKLPTTQNFQFLLRRRLNFQLCEVDVLQKMKRIEVRDFRRQQGKRITQKKRNCVTLQSHLIVGKIFHKFDTHFKDKAQNGHGFIDGVF